MPPLLFVLVCAIGYSDAGIIRTAIAADATEQRLYDLFNMGGRLYYTLRPEANVRFSALDSTYLDSEQIQWLERELKSSGSVWKIVFFHHPLYSSGRRHGSDRELREVLEPLFLKYNVSVVLTGHDHFYE